MVLQLPLPVCQRRCPGEPRFLLDPRECSATSVGDESGAQDGDQFQPSQDFCRSERVVSLFSLCVNPATTCLSPHEAASLAGCELVESSAVGTAGQKSLLSHHVRSVDQTMLRKIMRLTRCEHSALQKRPITVHPACAARRRACLSATSPQL